jgi:citrate synthase
LVAYLYQGTNIDGVSFSPEQLNVRGKNLNDIIGLYSYTGAIYNLLAGRDPQPSEEKALDNYLLQSLLSLDAAHPVIRVAELVARSGSSVSRAMIAGLMVEGRDALAKVKADGSFKETGLDDDRLEGLYYFGILPLLLACVVAVRREDGLTPVANLLEALRDDAPDYLSSLFRIVSGHDLGTGKEWKVFNAIMVSFHAGFGFLTPTVMLPRGAASTGVPMAQAIASGFTGAGPSHVGACEDAMRIFRQVADGGETELETNVCRVLDESLAGGKPVPGFGHPLFKQDPRVERLRGILRESSFDSKYIRVFDAFAARLKDKVGIHPNIDSISAAVFLSLGIEADYGTGLFLCSRASAMVAHILEMKSKPAFGVRSKDAREMLQSLPKEGAEYALVK